MSSKHAACASSSAPSGGASCWRRQNLVSRLLPPPWQGHLATDQALGIYWPLSGEADLRDLAAQILALPRVSEGTLTYRHWQAGDALSHDDSRILAPSAGP